MLLRETVVHDAHKQVLDVVLAMLEETTEDFYIGEHITQKSCQNFTSLTQTDGGPEKAIHQYPPSSYNYWIAAYPLSAHLFTPGAFGENLVTYPPQDSPSSPEMNENTLCIGDKIAFGPEVILQVCLPRQPCFKLNHRFGIKNFLGQVKETRRTG